MPERHVRDDVRWPNVVYIVGVLFASVGKKLYLCSEICEKVLNNPVRIS